MMLERSCNECAWHFEVLEHNDEAIIFDTGEPYLQVCPECGTDDLRSIIGVPMGIDLGDEAGVGRIYPYFDRSLNMRISNKNHRKQVLRQRGLVALDGDIDVETKATQEHYARTEASARLRALEKRYDTDPAFADHRRLRDRGWYEDRAEAAKRRD